MERKHDSSSAFANVRKGGVASTKMNWILTIRSKTRSVLALESIAVKLMTQMEKRT